MRSQLTDVDLRLRAGWLIDQDDAQATALPVARGLAAWAPKSGILRRSGGEAALRPGEVARDKRLGLFAGQAPATPNIRLPATRY